MNQVPSPNAGEKRIESQRYVVVKFADDVGLPEAPFTHKDLARQLPDDAAAVDAGFTFSAHLGSKVSSRLQSLMNRARKANPKYRPPNPLAYFRIEVSTEEEGQALLERLRTWNIVDYAYLHPGAVEPPAPNVADNPLANVQMYLDPAPMGVDAYYAWNHDGGKGQEQRLADVEWGWYQGHEDLAGINFTNITDGHYQRQDHGTNVLGIIAARDNTKQCVGIAHDLGHIVTVGQWRSDSECVTAPAVYDALDCLEEPGDVLLLEAQTTMYGHENIPLEAEPDVFELVELATTAGITVIAAAGNGTKNLDVIKDDADDPVFDRDSGAIIVAAASLETAPHPQWKRSDFSCHGARIDCFAQGNKVVTLDTNDRGTESDITYGFGGTSSASAIVAGAALVVQGIAQQHLGRKLEPGELRSLFRDATLNTPHEPSAEKIGVMPNLRGIIERLLASPTEDDPQDDNSEETMITQPSQGGESAPQTQRQGKKKGSKTLYVYLDTAKNPEVRVDPIVLGRKKIKWRKEDPDQDFKFKDIVFDPPGPFDVKKLEDDKINVKNDETQGDYKYTLTVETSQGDEYDTTESGPPAPGDKPVIRN